MRTLAESIGWGTWGVAEEWVSACVYVEEVCYEVRRCPEGVPLRYYEIDRVRPVSLSPPDFHPLRLFI